MQYEGGNKDDFPLFQFVERLIKMKKSASLFVVIAIVLGIISFGVLPEFASAQFDSATITESIMNTIDEITTQIFVDNSNAQEADELSIIENSSEDITEPQEEGEQEAEQEICTKYIYGYSEMNQPLEAFIINGYGANDKVFFMDFAVHGFEDEYDNDGKVLVDLGYSLVEYYSEYPEDLGDYTMVIVPCANPDGVMYGVNDHRAEEGDAFGRCTSAGIDMNRDFKAGCFKAVESKALKALMDEYSPSIYINFHGWENSVLGNPDLIRILVPGLDLSRGNPDWYRAEDGFIMGFVKEYYGAKSALVEFENSDSVSETKLIGTINKIILSDL